MIRSYLYPILSLILLSLSVYAACPKHGTYVQTLGSHGPELLGHAQSAYLIWHRGRARVLVDAGSGAALHFGRSGADLNDLVAITLSHLHTNHSNDMPSLVKHSFF